MVGCIIQSLIEFKDVSWRETSEAIPYDMDNGGRRRSVSIDAENGLICSTTNIVSKISQSTVSLPVSSPSFPMYHCPCALLQLGVPPPFATRFHCSQ
jgi:hypothetical protein